MDSDKGCEEKESRLWGERLGVALWIEWLGKAPVRRWNLSRDVNKAMDGGLGPPREEHCRQGEQQVGGPEGSTPARSNKVAAWQELSEEVGVTRAGCQRGAMLLANCRAVERNAGKSQVLLRVGMVGVREREEPRGSLPALPLPPSLTMWKGP